MEPLLLPIRYLLEIFTEKRRFKSGSQIIKLRVTRCTVHLNGKVFKVFIDIDSYDTYIVPKQINLLPLTFVFDFCLP